MSVKPIHISFREKEPKKPSLGTEGSHTSDYKNQAIACDVSLQMKPFMALVTI